ncbi:MAG: isocitrate lyase/PEP mutase family protein [Anaerolineales bacterium]|nr:MAG: isocitrate lyase/PEP mutase family protein [Anaerolineales bacterium]
MGSGSQLSKLLQAKNIIVAPGVLDALSARIAANAGFDCLYMSGYVNCAVMLGRPDFGLLTLPEMSARLRMMVDAAQKPVIADADTGYGNPINVRRTVTEYVRAGAAAIQLEDQTFPKRCGHMEGKQIIPAEQMVQKVIAAADTISELGSDMLIVARTDARALQGLDEAIRRGRMYAEAGADIIFIEAPVSREELAVVGQSFEVPLLVNLIEGAKTPILPLDELQELGFAIVIYPISALYVVSQTLTDFYGDLKRDGSSAAWFDKMISFARFNAFIGLGELRALEDRYKVVGS